MEGGHSEDETARLLSEFIDDSINWAAIAPAPLGALLEACDGEVSEALAREIMRRLGDREQRAITLEGRAEVLEARAQDAGADHPARAARLRQRAARKLARAARLQAELAELGEAG